MSEIEKKWYVLRAVSGKENKVERNILMLTSGIVILASMYLRY